MPGPARTARGFSIVELLVALALSAMLLAGVIAMFLGSRSSYAAADSLAKVHESGRYGLDAIVHDVRSAGFQGCAREQRVVTSSLPADQSPWDFLDAPLRGFDNVDGAARRPPADLELPEDVQPGTDVLLIRGPKRNAGSARLLRAMSDDADSLHVDAASSTGFGVGDVVLAHNCDARSYFAISGIADGVIEHAADAPVGQARANTTGSLGYAYSPPAELTAVETTIYYVAPSRSADALAALWRRTGAAAPEEIAVGVEQMQLQFGLDSAREGAPTALLSADQVPEWRHVRSVSIALLVHSAPVEIREGAPATFQLLDVAVAAPSDGRLRRSFVMAATPRNMTPAP